MRRIWAIPSFGTWNSERDEVFFSALAWSSFLLFARFFLSSYLRRSVPLCLGTVESISFRASIFSSRVLASLYFCCASRYSLVTLVGIPFD